MPDDIFPHPHEDESAEDPFTGPTDDIDEQSVGASPMNPLADARAPKKRLALFAIIAGIALIIVFFLLSGGGDEPAAEAGPDSQPTPDVVRDDGTARAQPREEPTAESIDEASRPTQRNRNSQQVFINPDDFAQPEVDSPAQRPTQAGQQPARTRAPGSAYPNPQNAPQNAYQGQSYSAPQGQGAAGPATDEEIERQARLERERRSAEQQRAEEQARLEEMAAEEERLRSAGTLIAENSGLDRSMSAGAASPAGSSRFGIAPAGRSASPAGGLAPSAQPEIVPGTKVQATLTSEFISDIEGGGQVEARLSQPLRSDGRTILPAGTRAFGIATATSPSAGRDARVAITFNTFVTPDGEVIRDVVGQAGDPETLAMSIEGDVDNRYLERVTRGVLSTAVDLALTSQADERRSTFEAPSPQDQAINDARRRAAAIINGPIGDEQSVDSAVRLEQGQQIVIIFGLR